MYCIRFRLENCSESDFVSFWESFYRYQDKEYDDHIKHDGLLEVIDIEPLLEWKNQSKLSGPKRKIAIRAKNELEELNTFRRSQSEISDKEVTDFWNTVSRIVKSGVVWRAFFFHIAWPSKYPMLDQHVVRSYYYLSRGEKREISMNTTKEVYLRLVRDYGDFFRNLKNMSGKEDREIDRALLCFGQFLKRYWQVFDAKTLV